MADCSRCGAHLEGPGLFCAYCGTTRELDGVRLAEAVRLVDATDAVEIIPYGTVLPTSFTDTYATAIDDQSTIQIHLVTGNTAVAGDTRTLVKLTLPLQQRGPAGHVFVVVTVRVETSGELSIRAEEQKTDNVFERSDFRVGVAKAT